MRGATEMPKQHTENDNGEKIQFDISTKFRFIPS